MSFDIKYSLKRKRQEKGDYYEIAFIGDVDKSWMDLFIKNAKDYNIETDELEWPFLYIGRKGGKWIIKEERGADSSAVFQKKQIYAMNMIVARTNNQKNMPKKVKKKPE